MRLIDADALKSKLRAQEWKKDPAVMLALDWIYGLINEQPTIDAVLVVRCGECKHYNKTCCSKGFGWCENIDRGTSDNFYCANGKQLNKESEVK
jgi:hypothetical protein